MNQKIVQTNVSEAVYESLWRVVRKKKRPLKAILRDAIEAYLRKIDPPDAEPLLAFVGRGKLKVRDWSVRKDWRA